MIDSDGYCDLCGSNASSGLCSSCDEEAYILRNQYDYIDTVSQSFSDKAAQQENKK